MDGEGGYGCVHRTVGRPAPQVRKVREVRGGGVRFTTSFELLSLILVCLPVVSVFVFLFDDVSEYVAECFNRRAFVSGFSGSAGTAVILKDEVMSLMAPSTDTLYRPLAEAGIIV